jgi:hypothetical protein
VAEKTIKTQETDPNPVPDGPTQYDESLKISQLDLLNDPLESDYAVLARANGNTYKITLGDLLADLDAYKVKTLNKGTYIENITESPNGSGNWTINAEKQGPGTSGIYVEKLNDATGALTLASSDGSISIDNLLRDAENNPLDPPQYNTTIDLTLNTTTSTMFRAWIEVDAATKVSGVFDFNNDKITKDNSIVTINGVVLEGTQYDLTEGTVTILNLGTFPLVVGDEIGVVSYTAEVPNSTFGNPTYGMRTSDISIVGEDPAGDPEPKAIAVNNLQTQQDVNWYLLRQIENLDIPDLINLPENIATTDDITAAVEGLATEAWVTERIDEVEIPSVEGLTTKDYVDNQDQVVQEWVENKNYLIDEGQNTQIDTLENKVKALEGTVVEAQYKADARDEPQIGSFVLKNMLNEKVLQFNQATYIILSETDFTNKPIDASKVMAGDIVRLVMSPSNYANFTVTSVANRNGNINLEVTFGSAGPEGIVFDGAVYDFTHTTPFDIGAACTKQYSDDQDAVTLKAAQDYADALDIPDAVVTDSFLSDEGEQHIKPEWKIRDPNKAYTYITIAPSGGMGLYHLKTPEASHHAVPVSYLEDVCFNSITNTLNLRSEESDHVKISCSDPEHWAPQNNEKNILRGNYKSNGGGLSEWSFGFNQHGQYWQYDWDMGNSNCCMTWHVKGDKKFTIDTSGAKMANAYIVRDTDFSGVAEEDYEAVSQAAVEIDIGHRLRELKNILVNLKTALKTKSADAQQALLDVLEHVEDI